MARKKVVLDTLADIGKNIIKGNNRSAPHLGISLGVNFAFGLGLLCLAIELDRSLPSKILACSFLGILVILAFARFIYLGLKGH